jgi:hypothetical protein
MKRRNRRINRHQKTASQHRKPPKGKTSAPERRGSGLQGPQPTKHKEPSVTQIEKRITSEILFLLYLKIRNVVLQVDPVDWMWRTVFKSVWDWICNSTLPHVPYTCA